MTRPKSETEDWLFSGPLKRRLLEVLLLDEQPRGGWTRTGLARNSGQHAKARLDKYLDPLRTLGLIRVRRGRYFVNRRHALAEPLAEVLRILAGR